ncbi:MAG: HAD-IA family hydrolase [Pirellulales bacterium]
MCFGQVSHVLLDAVGTLIYPSPSVGEVYQQAAADQGLHLPLPEVKGRFSQAYKSIAYPAAATSDAADRLRWQQVVSAVFPELFPVAQQATFETLWHHFEQPSAWKLFEDAQRLLKKLQTSQYITAVASNFDARLHTILQGHTELAWIPYRFISSEVGAPKPHPTFFASAANQLGVDSNQLLLVGDDYEADVLGGIAAGLHVAWLQRDPLAASESEAAIAKLRKYLPSQNQLTVIFKLEDLWKSILTID